ncbi:polysaccharide biosynthesis/export family protein [uncultured Lacinutrix sp.]|uniref:polysaccharide biosynthesis/export family protein n=1 Tax=uncultured Lacinutrix sp. TaxID=574032 RepID=UPI00261ED75D|nr:polysaccharide biosynthesis/export family protein [uncultured Lacinutrix sp.]
MNKFIVAITIVFSVLSTSCITNKDVVYLQDKGTVTDNALLLKELAKPYRVQINDILSIDIKSTDSELAKLVEIFQPTEKGSAGGQEGLYYSGFTVDLHGNIKFPILGDINVLGFTTDEIVEKVRQSLLKNYLKDISQIFVTVKLAGLRYTVSGEVNGTGVLTLYQDRVNIIEALANAGDIKDTGDRTDVMVIRQYPQGQKIHHIDLTDMAAMQSPYYYIQPNDMILVKPLKRKALGAGQTATQTFTTIASIFSVIVSTYFLARNL